MFEILFKYPASLFRKGHFVFLTPWPLWILAIASHATAWLTWWTFALGVAHLGIAALEVRQPVHRLRRRPTF